VLLNDVRSNSHYVRSLKIFFNSFSALINQLPSCFVLCLSSCVCLTRLTLLTFVYCAFDMIQLKRYIYLFLYFMLSVDVVKRRRTWWCLLCHEQFQFFEVYTQHSGAHGETCRYCFLPIIDGQTQKEHICIVPGMYIKLTHVSTHVRASMHAHTHHTQTHTHTRTHPRTHKHTQHTHARVFFSLYPTIGSEKLYGLVSVGHTM